MKDILQNKVILEHLWYWNGVNGMDRAYIDYEKFEELTEKGVIYVTKMKKSLVYSVLSDTMYQTPDGLIGSQDTECNIFKENKRWRNDYP